LHSTKLDHQTQQRSDNFLARENQHIRHGPTGKRGLLPSGNLWTRTPS
jgi:hypothetical protein